MADDAGETDLRRRAAWFLAMLVVAAVLVVVVMTTLLDSPGKSTNNGNPAPDDALSPSTTTSHTSRSSPPDRRRSSGSTSSHGSSASTGPATASCPTEAPCALQGDAAQAVAAINDYRTEHGRSAVPGTVSTAAQACALSDGSRCTGGWAESQVAKLDGAAAVAKIAALGKLLDSHLTSFGVGWAYAPQQKMYYFAIVRKD